MGNCQAIDTATLVVQHPCGKVDKFYWPVSASEIMRNNPGHYVALLISTTLCNSSSSSSHQTNNNNNDKCPNTNTNTNTNTTNNNNNNNNNGSSSVRLTRIKLLRPTETLVLGQVYRLITSQDVMKGLLAKKNGKKNKNIMPESADHHEKPTRSDQQLDNKDNNNNHKVMKHEKHRPRTSSSSTAASTNSNSNSSSAAASSKSRIWQPSLQSISEAAS